MLSPEERAQVKNIFTYHPPTPAQQRNYERIREAAQKMAIAIMEECPESADRASAIRKLRECVMTANAAVALEGKI